MQKAERVVCRITRLVGVGGRVPRTVVDDSRHTGRCHQEHLACPLRSTGHGIRPPGRNQRAIRWEGCQNIEYGADWMQANSDRDRADSKIATMMHLQFVAAYELLARAP